MKLNYTNDPHKREAERILARFFLPRAPEGALIQDWQALVSYGRRLVNRINGHPGEGGTGYIDGDKERLAELREKLFPHAHRSEVALLYSELDMLYRHTPESSVRNDGRAVRKAA